MKYKTPVLWPQFVKARTFLVCITLVVSFGCVEIRKIRRGYATGHPHLWTRTKGETDTWLQNKHNASRFFLLFFIDLKKGTLSATEGDKDHDLLKQQSF